MSDKLKPKSAPKLPSSRKEECHAILREHGWKQGSSTRHMDKEDRAEVKAALKALAECKESLVLEPQEPEARKEPMSAAEANEVLEKHNYVEGSTTRSLKPSARQEVKEALKALAECNTPPTLAPKKEPKQIIKTPRIGPSASKPE